MVCRGSAIPLLPLNADACNVLLVLLQLRQNGVFGSSARPVPPSCQLNSGGATNIWNGLEEGPAWESAEKSAAKHAQRVGEVVEPWEKTSHVSPRSRKFGRFEWPFWKGVTSAKEIIEEGLGFRSPNKQNHYFPTSIQWMRPGFCSFFQVDDRQQKYPSTSG